MKGTTSLLRLLFERELGKNHEGEFIRVNGAETHPFDAFALVNFLLCSATAGGKKGDSTPIMRKNCGRHFQAAITILQPTILVCQGAGVANWLKTAFDVRGGRIQKGELDIQVLEFTHPSSQGNANNWGWNDRTPYLLGTVEPRVKEALKKIDRV
jgi:uracil-DNA glycosylase